MRLALAVGCLLIPGCARYAEFTLPAEAGNPGKVSYEWDVHPSPVLTRGTDWDRIDALNPSVVVDASGLLLNYYSGFDGKSWHTGLAVSRDGLSWEKKTKVLSPDPSTWEGDYIAANGSSLRLQDGLRHWYQGGRVPQIGLAVDAKKHGPAVLPSGPRGSWDERGVAD